MCRRKTLLTLLYIDNKLCTAELGEWYKVRWAIQSQVSDTGWRKVYILGWAIQAQVSDTGWRKVYILGWAIPARLNYACSCEDEFSGIGKNLYILQATWIWKLKIRKCFFKINMNLKYKVVKCRYFWGL